MAEESVSQPTPRGRLCLVVVDTKIAHIQLFLSNIEGPGEGAGDKDYRDSANPRK